MERAEIALQVPLVVRHRHSVHAGRRLPPQPPERSFERRDVEMVEQRREAGLARPRGRIVHPDEMRMQGFPALRLDLPVLARGPQWSGPSLRSARCLRRHQQYYAPIRHPTAHRALPPVLPRQTSAPVTSRSMRWGFSGSHAIPANVTWSPTPAARALLASCAALGVAFGRMNSLGDRDQPITWLNTDPVRLLSTLSPLRYRRRTQDSLPGAWLVLTRAGLPPAGHHELPDALILGRSEREAEQRP
jgi:hypothetical protein